MKYTIICDRPNRLRVRFGKYILSKEQCYGITDLLLAFDGVKSAIATYHNGSVLIEYDLPATREGILQQLSIMTLVEIPEPQPNNEQSTALIDMRYKKKLALHCAGHLLRYLFLPIALHRIYVWYRAIKFLRLGLNALLEKRLNVEVLDATAILTSICCKNYSTASSTMFLLKLSDILLQYSNMRAKQALAQSLSIGVEKVWLVGNNGEISISISQLKTSDIIRIRKGALIPVDGSIVCGDALVNEATMTGEPLAVHKTIGATVFAGTVLEDGEIDVEVVSLNNESRIAKIISLIDSGEREKANVQGKAERLADDIVPLSFGLFLVTLITTRNISRALSVLMVDFSCAIKLTTPITIISALKEGVNNGVLVKGGKFLEKLAKVDTIVFDKTGTLTNAVPKVSKIIPIKSGYSAETILRIAACLEEHFPHSVAASIVAEAKRKGLHHPEDHGKVEYIVAHGLVSSYNGCRAIIGSKHFVFDDEKIPFSYSEQQQLSEEIGSDSSVYLAIDGELVGIICVNDPPREDARQTIDLLHSEGIDQILMITGDSEGSAKHTCELLGIDSYYAHVLPDKKAKIIEGLKAQGRTVLMVGDGINDTPALSCADVSLTLNGSSDIAREVADIAIMSEDLTRIMTVRRLAHNTINKIYRQYSFIVSFNAVLIGLGIFGAITANRSAWLHNASTIALTGLSTRPVLKKKDKVFEEEPAE